MMFSLFLIDIAISLIVLIAITCLIYVLIVRIGSIVGTITGNENWANKIWKSWFQATINLDKLLTWKSTL